MTNLMVATAGGHLSQLLMLAPRLGIDFDNSVWVTTRTPQATSALSDAEVVWAPYASPRDARRAFEHGRLAWDVTGRRAFSAAISTGASLAVPFLAAARMRGVTSSYIESATRVEGPSLAGRLVARIPGVGLYTQHDSWAGKRWAYRGSVFDGWATKESGEGQAVAKVLVSVGSAKGYPFDRMLRAVQRAVPNGADVLWQVGESGATDLPGRVAQTLTGSEMTDAIMEADVIVSHAGTGSVLSCLQAGKLPLIIPRSALRGEHIDEHQNQIAHMLSERGLALVRQPETLVADDFHTVAATRVMATPADRIRLG